VEEHVHGRADQLLARELHLTQYYFDCLLMFFSRFALALYLLLIDLISGIHYSSL
jgi:hypothetical protein